MRYSCSGRGGRTNSTCGDFGCISIIFRNLQAIEQLEQAKALAEEVGNETIRSQWLATKNLAACFKRLGQIEKAVELFEHCLVISKTKAYRKSHPDFIFDDGVIFPLILLNSVIAAGTHEHSLSYLSVCLSRWCLMPNAVWQTPWSLWTSNRLPRAGISSAWARAGPQNAGALS